jgi:hypothetical protein
MAPILRCSVCPDVIFFLTDFLYDDYGMVPFCVRDPFHIVRDRLREIIFLLLRPTWIHQNSNNWHETDQAFSCSRGFC